MTSTSDWKMLRTGFLPRLKPHGVTLIYTSNANKNTFFIWWLCFRGWTGKEYSFGPLLSAMGVAAYAGKEVASTVSSLTASITLTKSLQTLTLLGSAEAAVRWRSYLDQEGSSSPTGFRPSTTSMHQEFSHVRWIRWLNYISWTIRSLWTEFCLVVPAC